VRDVTSGIQGGTISPTTGQALTTQAQQAVTDELAGRPDQAARDLQQAAALIANAAQAGTMQPSEVTTLQADLTALAGTLGLSAASQAPSTTTTSSTLPGPGPGGGGHKNKIGG
jgi:hypothetical protein